MSETRRGLFSDVCKRIRALDPSAPPGTGLELIAHELEKLDATYIAERAQVAIETKRRMADLEELHNANRLVTVGTLTAGMAHELGTPLGVILARAQMILTDDVDLGEARDDADEIVRQVTRMTQMCREVLDFARPKPPMRDVVDIVRTLRQAIELLVPEARTRAAKLVLVGEPPPTLVLGDPSKLMQVFTNLMINAAQAMPDDRHGGTVTLRVEIRHVQPPAVERLPDADYICIDVEDTGTGIRKGDLDRIFETFFTTKKAEGSGLGLAVSYRIAREHDGWIGVITREGNGSTFTVYLPPVASAAVSGSGAAPQRSSLR